MLKTRLTEVDEEMEKLTSNERLSADKVVELVDLLRVEVSRNDENGRAMECIEVGALNCLAHVLCCSVHAKWTVFEVIHARILYNQIATADCAICHSHRT